MAKELSEFQFIVLSRFIGKRYVVPMGLQTRSCETLYRRGLMDREMAWTEKESGKVTWGYRTNAAGRNRCVFAPQ